MIVIVLIGILSAAILPEMRGTYEEALLRSTSRKLIGVFQLANSRAITLRETQTVRLDRKNGRFFLEGAVPHGEERGRLQPVRNVPGCAGELDPRIAIELRKLDEDPLENPDDEEALAAKKMLRSQGDAIAFYPDGTAESGEVRLKDRAGFRLALRISATTARVTLVDLGPE
jgi:type II secretory pathway pseudopilin PulG